MSNENFSFKDYSLAPADLVPPEESDEPEVDERQARQARHRHEIVLEDVLLCALEHFQERAEVLAFVQDAVECPYDPARTNVHVSDASRIANAFAMDVQAAIDDITGLLDMDAEPEDAEALDERLEEVPTIDPHDPSRADKWGYTDEEMQVVIPSLKKPTS
jgi:hypothetical protein